MKRDNTLIIGIFCFMACVIALTAYTHGIKEKAETAEKQEKTTTSKSQSMSYASLLSVN